MKGLLKSSEFITQFFFIKLPIAKLPCNLYKYVNKICNLEATLPHNRGKVNQLKKPQYNVLL